MKLLVRQVLNPLLSRVGTLLAGALAAQGVNGETTQQIVTGIIALGLVVVDLAIDKVITKKGPQ
jgi:hypothetical protein